jgi:hypothetical protein
VARLIYSNIEGGKGKMKRIYQSLKIFFFAIILTGMISGSQSSAEEGSCYLKSLNTDVFVIVYDLNRNGDMGSLLWQGRINKGQEVFIRAPHARFRYYYNAQPDVNQPMSGGNSRWCDNQRTVGVP